jgi:hypothetical protein
LFVIEAHGDAPYSERFGVEMESYPVNTQKTTPPPDRAQGCRKVDSACLFSSFFSSFMSASFLTLFIRVFSHSPTILGSSNAKSD